MKGFIFVCVLAAVVFVLKWAYARFAAKKDPVDVEPLKDTNFPGPYGGA